MVNLTSTDTNVSSYKVQGEFYVITFSAQNKKIVRMFLNTIDGQKQPYYVHSFGTIESHKLPDLLEVVQGTIQLIKENDLESFDSDVMQENFGTETKGIGVEL